MSNSLHQAFNSVLQKIANANQASGRPQKARLLAVSKMQPASAVRDLAALGQKVFGENYVQEAIKKQDELKDLQLQWHLIGPLQSNKCPEAAQHFDWIHSVGRLKLVEPLNRYRPDNREPLNVLIQVNIDSEDSKSGCTPDEIDALAAAIAKAPRLKLRGLMAIPEPAPTLEARRESFRQLRALFERLKTQYAECDTLSMGMSDDYELAIQEGSTLVRIGSSLFGARKT